MYLTVYHSYGPAHREKAIVMKLAATYVGMQCKGFTPMLCNAHVMLSSACQFCDRLSLHVAKLKLTSAGAR